MKKSLIIGLFSLSLVLTACNSHDTKEAKSEGEESSKIEQSQDIEESSNEENKTSKNEGPVANDFKFQDLDGNEYKLSDQKGKKVYIKFWASWCPICLDSMEELDQMFTHDKDYEMITVVTPGKMGEKSKDEFIEWFKDLDYKNIKVLLDESGQILTDYGIRSAPTNILIGSDGVVMGVVPGQLDEQTIDEVFTEIK